MSKQYCFEINNSNGVEFDINELKKFVEKLYVGRKKHQFNKDDNLPFVTIYSRMDNSVCILMTGKGIKNIERIESINQKLSSKDLEWERGIKLGEPYEFDVEAAAWWGGVVQPPGIGGKKRWTSLRQNGPYFKDLLEPYEHLRSFLTYNGKRYYLNPEEEKIASFYAKRKISEASGGIVDELTKDKVFNDNFWNDFKKYLSREHKNIFKDFSKIGWGELIARIESDKGELTDYEKIEKKIRNEEIKRYYGYAFLDGHREKVGNFIVEPQAIFYGRGANPNRGRIKKQISPEDVTINIGYNDPIPVPPTGHKWGKIVNDYDAVWLAKWNDSITGDTKYVMFSSEGRFKGEADLVKYEKARKLEIHIDRVRDRYMNDATSKNIIKMQLGTVLFLIDNFGVRVGNERKEDEADTVGASTLRVDHIKLKSPDRVIFDFLGKDSIRFYKELKVPELIYNNFKKLIEGKKNTEQVFNSISSRSINAYLKEFDKSFSAKVFRTRLASKIMYEALKTLKIPKDATKSRIKTIFNKANAKVADVLNHTRNVSKKAQDSVKKYKDELKGVDKELKQMKKEGNNKKIKALEKRRETLKNRIESKTDVMAVAISTSLTNYIDPRLIVGWSKIKDIDISAVYTSALIRKFQWAIETTDKKWDWLTSPLIGNAELEPLEEEGMAVEISAEDKPPKKNIKKVKPHKPPKPSKKPSIIPIHPKPDKQPKPNEISDNIPTVLLLGDSIIDNSHWNDVESDSTSEYLRRMGVNVIDRATEEVFTDKFFDYMNGDKPGISVDGHYVQSRANKGIPYDGFIVDGKYYVEPIPNYKEKNWWNISKDKRFATLSLGSNDLALLSNFNIEYIQTKIDNVIKYLLNKLDIIPKNFIYIIPYSPHKNMIEIINPLIQIQGMNVEQFYQKWVNSAKQMCDNLGITYISLSDFTDDDRWNDKFQPKPTKQGSRKIAERIYDVIKKSFTQYIGPGSKKDYELILRICKEPDKYKFKFVDLPKDVMDWIYPFSKYATDKGNKIKANEYITKFYEAAYLKVN